MTTTEIAEMITATLEEHRATRDSLAWAIVTMLEPIPSGTVITSASHTVEMRKVYCGCSQWCNGTWDVTGSADGYLVDGALIRNEDPSVWDGRNCHSRKTPLYLHAESDEAARGLKLATAKALRSLARALPEALAAYVAGKQADTSETKAALAALSPA